MDILKQILQERQAKELIEQAVTPQKVGEMFEKLLERKRYNALKTSEAVLGIIRELKRG